MLQGSIKEIFEKRKSAENKEEQNYRTNWEETILRSVELVFIFTFKDILMKTL